MDKNKCTKKNGHKTLSYEELEDECEYNYRRKEELKKEVQRLKDDNDELRDTNFKNVEVYQKVKAKLYELKTKLEIADQANKDSDMNAGRLECAKGVIDKLKDDLQCMKNENVESTEKYRNFISDLENKIKKLLSCDECGENFKEKTDLRSHIYENHFINILKCNVCGEKFECEGDIKQHNETEHQSNIKRYHCDKKQSTKNHKKEERKTKLIKYQTELEYKIAKQTAQVLGSLLLLKQKEEKENRSCRCKARVCKINHNRYRWSLKKSSSI